jgi:hypothetical protein
MTATSTQSNVKLIGANGQISIGKQYAGRQVLVEEQEPGVWLVRTVTVIPDNELWLHTPQSSAELQRALRWAATHPSDDTDVDALMVRLADEQD